MSVAKASISLEWKDHSVDLEALESWLKDNAGDKYCGNSADKGLTLWFLDEPGEEVRKAIADKWAELDDEKHEMAQSYESQAERQASKEKAKQDAIKKLAKASGLTQTEIKALLG